MRTFFSILSSLSIGCTLEEPTSNDSPSIALVPEGACEYTDSTLDMDTAMGDGFSAQDVVDITEGVIEDTLSWNATGETTELILELVFTPDSAVWREGIYVYADGNENPTIDCQDEMLLLATLYFDTADGRLAEQLDVEVRSPNGTFGRIDHQIEASALSGSWVNDLDPTSTVEFAINHGSNSSTGEIAVALDEMEDVARW